MELFKQRQELLRHVAKLAGESLRSHFGMNLEIQHKGEIDLVTQADREAERLVLDQISTMYPADAILAEESGRKEGQNAWQWIVDPLDGTTNFASGFPHFSVSLALAYESQILAGIVFDPIKEDWFEAALGKGSTRNGEPIHVRQQTELNEALTATGFPYDRRQRLPQLLDRIGKILTHTRGLRRMGSAALDLAYVAAGRLDIFVEDGLNPWDVAAGYLLVTEAGGTVTHFCGTKATLGLGEVVACNPQLVKPVLKHLI